MSTPIDNIDAMSLMEGHIIQRERVPGTALQTRQVLYFRADKVIAMLKGRNEHLKDINDRLSKVVEKHRERQAMLAEADALLRRIMARLADLLDEDQFNEIDQMVTDAHLAKEKS